MIDVGVREERIKGSFKFSRKFRGLDRVKSEFAGSKVLNSRENSEERCLVTLWKGYGVDGFRYFEVIERSMVYDMIGRGKAEQSQIEHKYVINYLKMIIHFVSNYKMAYKKDPDSLEPGSHQNNVKF
jgi:hypothetical protein